MTFASDQFLAAPEWVHYLNGRLPDETPHADDVFFDGSSNPTGLTVSGTVTWTEARGLMSAVYDDQTAEDMACQLYSFTTASVPMTVETAYRMDGATNVIRMAGVTISDGTTSTSNMVRAGFYLGGTPLRRFTFAEGTFTAHATAAGDEINHDNASQGIAYVQLIWTASNTFKSRWSIDGVTWYDPFGTDAQTMTPTHYGVWVSTWGGAVPSLASFNYIRVYDSDLSV